jgi:inner membrane protein
VDPLTHTATGLFLSRAGLNRFSPHATAILLLAANAPDADVVCAAGGALTYLNYHRHLTHSLLLIPVMAALPVLVVRLATRKRLPWLPALAISMVGVLSHLLLDLTNIYGIRLGLPFTGTWYRLDQTSVIDFWIWGAALLGVAGPLLSRLVSSEIGARRASGRGGAVFALTFLLLYNGTRAVLHERAVAVLDSRLYSGGAPLRVAALPNPVNPLQWSGLVETRDAYSLHRVNLLADFNPAQGFVFYKPEASPVLDAAGRTQVFQEFLRFSQFPYWRAIPVPEPEGGTLVEAMDMRFGSPPAPGFVASAVLDSRLEVLRSAFSFGHAGPR